MLMFYLPHNQKVTYTVKVGVKIAWSKAAVLLLKPELLHRNIYYGSSKFIHFPLETFLCPVKFIATT